MNSFSYSMDIKRLQNLLETSVDDTERQRIQILLSKEAPRRFRESEPRDRMNCGMSAYGPSRYSATSRYFGS